MEPAFLHIRGLSKAFNGRTVLESVDLDVRRGSIVTLMGKSGIGKSVLLKCITGILPRDAGVVRLQGKAYPSAEYGEGAPRLSYLFQQNALFDSMTTAENVAVPLVETSRISRREARRKVDALFEMLDLKDIAGRYPAEISGGMQKRVALARALITEPQLILFDEPTTGLDPERKNNVFSMIADYRRRFDFTALMVSHDIPEALFVSDRVAWLDGGRIRFEGAPSDLEDATEPELVDFVFNRGKLLSDTAGLRGRTELIADWPRLRGEYACFILASCTTMQRQPGSELGLRRFHSMRAAAEAASKLPARDSASYFLDDRHFGFAASTALTESQVQEALEKIDQTSDTACTRYKWQVRCFELAATPNPHNFWQPQAGSRTQPV